MIWDEPEASSSISRLKIKKKINEKGLKLVGFHSLLYTRPDLQFFRDENSRKKTIDYLINLIKICAELGGKNLILGSPSNRMLHGKSYKKCFDQSIEDFKELGIKAKEFDINFCIEPLAKNISEFICTNQEGASLVKSVGHSNFKLHLDTKTIYENSDDIELFLEKNINICEHIHISEINLAPLTNKLFNHSNFSKALKKYKYDKFLSIEMRKDQKNKKENIKKSIFFLRKNYLTNE